MLYDVHIIRENANGHIFDLDEDFAMLSRGLERVLERWNDVRVRNSAQLYAKKETCEKLRNMIAVLTAAIDDAESTAKELDYAAELDREAKMLEDYAHDK